MTQTPYDVDQILMGGRSAPAWKFDNPGETRTGIIATPPTARQERDYDPNNPGGGALKTFPSGDPIMGIVIELATDERAHGEDDGKRTFYVEGRYLKEAVRDAVKASGAQRLEVGARLTVTFTHREDPMDRRSRKYWKVVYTPAAQAQLMESTPPAWAQAPAPAVVQTEQGAVNTATGEIATPAPAAPPTTLDPSAAKVAALKAAGVTDEVIAQMRAAGQL